MNNDTSHIALFYRRGKIITAKQDLLHRTLFQAANQKLAEHISDNMRTPHLFSSDIKNSIIHTHNGESTEQYAYTPFGYSTSLPSEQTLLGFNGEYITQTLKNYQLGQGYRTYSPGLMRFQSPDSHSPFGQGGVNCYAYCSGDPVNYTDPTGHALVHLKNGQTMRISKNSAVALPHKFKPSTLKRTTSHASALKPGTPRYSAATGPTDHFMKIGEPDVFESIVSNLSFNDAHALANTSSRIKSFTAPIIHRYLARVSENDATMGAARAGALPGVPAAFGRSLGLARPDFLNDINHIQNLGGPQNFLRLMRYSLREDRMNALGERPGYMDDLIVDID